MWFNISKGTSWRKTRLWVCKVKIWSQCRFWDSTFGTLNLQYLILKLLEGFGAKKSVMSKLTSELPKYQYFRFPNFKSLFLKINFSPICYDILNKNCHISRTQCLISKILAPKLRWKNSHLGNSKKSSILIFWDNWSLSMCWDTYTHDLIVPIWFPGIQAALK